MTLGGHDDQIRFCLFGGPDDLPGRIAVTDQRADGHGLRGALGNEALELFFRLLVEDLFVFGDAERDVRVRRPRRKNGQNIDHRELGLKKSGQVEGAVESLEGGFAEIDGTKDFFDRKHVGLLESTELENGRKDFITGLERGQFDRGRIFARMQGE